VKTSSAFPANRGFAPGPETVETDLPGVAVVPGFRSGKRRASLLNTKGLRVDETLQRSRQIAENPSPFSWASRTMRKEIKRALLVWPLVASATI